MTEEKTRDLYALNINASIDPVFKYGLGARRSDSQESENEAVFSLRCHLFGTFNSWMCSKSNA